MVGQAVRCVNQKAPVIGARTRGDVTRRIATAQFRQFAPIQKDTAALSAPINLNPPDPFQLHRQIAYRATQRRPARTSRAAFGRRLRPHPPRAVDALRYFLPEDAAVEFVLPDTPT